MGVYDRQVATAERLIREKGKAVELVRQEAVVDNPDQPWLPGVPTQLIEETQAVFLNFNQNDMETIGKMSGASEILDSDRKVLMAAAGLSSPPTTVDKIRDEDGDWAIEWVQVLSPNGQNILYTLRARR